MDKRRERLFRRSSNALLSQTFIVTMACCCGVATAADAPETLTLKGGYDCTSKIRHIPSADVSADVTLPGREDVPPADLGGGSHVPLPGVDAPLQFTLSKQLEGPGDQERTAPVAEVEIDPERPGVRINGTAFGEEQPLTHADCARIHYKN